MPPARQAKTNPLRPALFRFLKELKDNNTRDWFQENKERYEADLRGPALEFIGAFGTRLHKISKNFEADPRKSGGSLFRIHRDTRFSKDKSPYKTSTGIQFRHSAGRDAHAPCFYLHLEPGQCFAAGGVWHPDGEALGRIREALVEDHKGFRRATSGAAFQQAGLELQGDSLKRAPRGFDPDHPAIEDLRRKDFIAVTELKQKDITSADFDAQLAGIYKACGPLVKWLCGAREQPY